MGTRSLTVILDDDGTEICVLYRQYDGYPTGHGDELKDFLQGFTIVNGLSGDAKLKIANRMECLAAQIVAHFKKEPGGFYLHPAGTRDCGEEYVYTVYLKEHKLMLKVQGGAVTFFGLPGTKQLNMPVLYDGLVDWFDPEKVESNWRENGLSNVVNDFVDEQILSGETLEVPDDSHITKS
jgi:hypothetical protein